MEVSVKSGIHPIAREEINISFSEKEQDIAKYWSGEWYITFAGSLLIGTSNYRYMLVKATDTYEESLSLSKEIVVIFSAYPTFEPRTLDAFESVYRKFQAQRLERICYVLISFDANIENDLSECINGQESQIVVPFSYHSFSENKGNSNFIRGQFRRFFYSRDLFDYSAPLRKDYYFFGRNDLTIDIIEKHKSGQNAGLFGLRRTGKTSIIFDIVRKAPQKDSIGIFIDCQSTSFNFKRWNYALYYVVCRIYDEIGQSCEELSESMFTEDNAETLFEKYIRTAFKFISRTIILIFDEIENITFDKSGVEHWCNGLDFVFFWQSIRSTFHRANGIFTFCIVGTNPRCVEEVTIKGKDNPIFNAFQPRYIPGFDITQTRDMVRKLGRLMGIRFDDSIYTKLNEDYGGHPFLIRQLCSYISKKYPNRPITVDRSRYLEARDQFNIETEYFSMILDILLQYYSSEYEMLKLLALEDMDTFQYYATEDYSLVKHLLGYGIINVNDGRYDFKIDSVKSYILRQERKVKLAKTIEEKWEQICLKRNVLEANLRRMVKTIIRFALKSESDAKEYVIKKVFNGDAKKYYAYTYSDLFDPKKSNMFLKYLKDIILSDWDCFKDYWKDQATFIASMNMLNKEGRFDAHAAVPSDAEMAMISSAVDYISGGIRLYQDTLS